MKRITAALALLISFSGIQAQYKKASFFDKEGRTYGVGVQSHFFGDGKKAAPGLSFHLAATRMESSFSAFGNCVFYRRTNLLFKRST
jgi:hypothetical protein